MSTIQNNSTKEKKSKWRLTNLRHQEKEKPVSDVDTDTQSQNIQDIPTDDSTYGSSNPNSTMSNIPTISNTQAAEQNAPISTHTDRATGRTITTTVTTTTTTVTTTDGDHYQVPAGQEVRVTETKETKPAGPIELSAHPGTPGVHTEKTADPLASTTNPRVRTPSPPPPPPPAAVIERYGGAHPTEPRTEPGVGRVSPVSPIRPNHGNFSYPARTPGAPTSSTQLHQPRDSGYSEQVTPLTQSSGQNSYSQQPYQPNTNITSASNAPPQPPRPQQRPYYDPVPHEPEHLDSRGAYQQPGEQPGHPGYGVSQTSQPQRMGTLQGLKAAAAGIHGAGETLRGTLNSSIERRTGGDPTRVAANDAIAQHGMEEIKSGKFYHANRQGQTGVPSTQGALHPTMSGHAYGQHPAGYAPPSQAGGLSPQPSAGLQQQQQSGQPPLGQAGQRYDPLEGTWVDPSTEEQRKEKKGGLRNVLRRKEVGSTK